MDKDKQQAIPNVLIRLAHLFGTDIKNGRLDIPEKFGKGYCTGFVFNEHIRLLISNYELKEDIVMDNPEVKIPGRMLFFKFQHIIALREALQAGNQPKSIPSVLIATSRLNTDDVISIHTNTAAINIEIDAGYLSDLFSSSGQSPVLQSLLQNTQPLLFEQLIYPSLQKIADEIVSESINETFKSVFLRIKSEELICRLLMELEKRDEKRLYPLNVHDIQTVYKIKDRMLEHLETPPVIKELAARANMSPSKLKRLFKQIFGTGIFGYYQEFRMREAARLLKEEKLSVSDTGYQLGFTNLSHFSRVFTEHVGMKPKQFSRS